MLKRNGKLAIRRTNPMAPSQKTDKINLRGAVSLSTIRLIKKIENVKTLFAGRKNNYFRSIHSMESVKIEISIWRFGEISIMAYSEHAIKAHCRVGVAYDVQSA